MPPSKVIGFVEARRAYECCRVYDIQSIKNEKSEEIANIKQHLKYYYGNFYFWLLPLRFIYYFIIGSLILIILVFLARIIVPYGLIYLICCKTESASINDEYPKKLKLQVHHESEKKEKIILKRDNDVTTIDCNFIFIF
jgi:hypothetical protein